MLEDESDDEANNEFDRGVHEGTEVEGAPVADRVVRLTNRLICTYILFVLTTLHISCEFVNRHTSYLGLSMRLGLH